MLSPSQQATPYVKKYKETRKEIRGQTANPSSKNFEDSAYLPETKDYNISAITFWYNEEIIMGLETLYTLADGSKQTVESIPAGEMKDEMKQATLQLIGQEYISQVEAFYNFHCIEFIKMSTSRGKTLEVGCKKYLARCRKLHYDIRKNETPMALLGATDFPLKKNSNLTMTLVPIWEEDNFFRVIRRLRPERNTRKVQRSARAYSIWS